MVPGLPNVLPPDHHEVEDTDGDPRLDVEAQASQWRLMWLAFRRNRLAVLGLVIVALLYFVAAFAEFLAPFEASSYDSRAVYHPPQEFQLFDRSAEGGWDFAPHFVGMKLVRDPLTLQGEFQPDPESKIGVEFFTRGWSYNFLGLIPTDLHLFGPSDPDERFYVLGADRLGRDMLSRIIAGTRISMSIGLVGVALTLVLGLILGGIAGYYGGKIDSVIQRIIEVVMSLPSIPIWLGLSAAMPMDWSSVTRYFAITLILSLMAWVELARVVRGRFLALRNEEFVAAARLDGGSEARIIFRHMLPSLTSHVIASVTLAIPAMILAETALVLPRPRPAAADRVLGRAAAGGAERPLARRGPVAVLARRAGPGRRAGAELHGRRDARRRRSLFARRALMAERLPPAARRAGPRGQEPLSPSSPPSRARSRR